jgi:hypothetical protein
MSKLSHNGRGHAVALTVHSLAAVDPARYRPITQTVIQCEDHHQARELRTALASVSSVESRLCNRELDVFGKPVWMPASES